MTLLTRWLWPATTTRQLAMSIGSIEWVRELPVAMLGYILRAMSITGAPDNVSRPRIFLRYPKHTLLSLLSH